MASRSILDDLDIETAATPLESPPLQSGDLTCEVCGKPLHYAGRGRKPKFCDDHRQSKGNSGTRRTSGKASVDLACDSLMQVYNAVCIPLTIINPVVGQTWEAQISALDARNRVMLATNPDLVKRINSVSERGGNVAFLISHLIAIGPVALVAAQSVTAARAERAQEADHFSETENVSYIDPDAVFRQ